VPTAGRNRIPSNPYNEQDSPVNRLPQIRDRIAPLKAALASHPIYQEIDRLEAMQIFMQSHVYAVWDFMSLLKALQRRLTCVEVPWMAVADPAACRLIHEIVLAEESDEDGDGGFISHFEMYRRAMIHCGAETLKLDRFLTLLRQGLSVSAALSESDIPRCARQFVAQTFEIIDGGNLAAIAAAFTFGREDLLPAVFQSIVNELNEKSGGGLDEFKYYLNRHIGLDGDEHGPMAQQLLVSICGDEETQWQLAEQTAVNSLESRRQLWDGILAEIQSSRSAT